MNQLVPFTAHASPALIVAAGDHAGLRFLQFFTANIRNRNTRRAYAQAAREFLAWCKSAGVSSITAVQPMHVAGYIEELTRERSAPTAKQRLAAIRHLFNWLVIGQVMPVNPASSVRGPSHIVKKGKTPVLSPKEARLVLDAIDVTTHVGLRDRALIGLMVYSFARIIQRLACRHLIPQEIVSASRERRSKYQDERLVPLIGRKPQGKRTTISISLGFDYIASYWHPGELELKPDRCCRGVGRN
jgi:integrase/recombinase XerC